MRKVNTDDIARLRLTRPPGCTTLWVSAVFPGFLFKDIDSLEEGRAIGGFAVSNPSATIIHLGLDGASALFTNRVGCIARPGSVVERSADAARGSYKTLIRMLAASDDALIRSAFKNYKPAVIVPSAPVVERVVGADCCMLGIVSRVDRGTLMVLHEGAVMMAPHGMTSPDVLPTYVFDYPYLTQGGDRSLWLSAPDYVFSRYKEVSGYMNMSVEVEKKAFLQRGKPLFMAHMAGSPQEVIDAYSNAYDTIVQGSTGVVADGLVLYPAMVDGAVLWSAHEGDRPEPAQAHDGSYAIWEDTTEIATTSHVQFSASNLTTRVAGNRSGFNHELGAPYLAPEFIVAGQSAGPGIPTDVFSLDAVPFIEVKISRIWSAPASAMVSVIGPRVGPAADAVGTLDISGRVQELQDYYDPSFYTTPKPFGNSVDGSDTIEAAGETVKLADSVLAELAGNTSFESFVVQTINKLDKLVLQE